MSFTNPWALLGLLLIPFIIWLGRPQNWNRQRATIALVLRVLIVTLLVLGLSGLQIVRATDQLAVIFLIDASDSMPPQTVDAARQYANDAIDRLRPTDEAAVVVFGSDALVERPMTPASAVGPIESEVIPLNTDLAEAIRLGMALYPPGAARRMVIMSDGLANVGDAEEAARLAAASGIQIQAVPFAALSGQEVLVTNVDVPTSLNLDQAFDITVTVESSVNTNAVMRILGGGEVIVEETVGLVEGLNRYAFTLTATQPGLTSFRVQVVPEGEDVFYQNNELAAFTQVVGPPRVLLVTDDPAEIANLGPALLQQGLQVDTTDSQGLPPDLATLSSYDSIVLANVRAAALGNTRMQALQTYVRDLGGGLVVVGGPNAYAPGGYFETPLEATLPVEMQLKDQERLPQLTVMYVIDKSGSMADTSVGGIAKVELAKEAIIRSMNLLNPFDRAGVMAFDDNAQVVLTLQQLNDVNAAALQVGTLRAGGGTDIFAGLTATYPILQEDPGRLRHIVLLTDGGANPQGIPELVQQNYEEHGITLSVISIGQTYAPFLEDLPKLADGRFHWAFDTSTIPEIFSEETVIATRAYIIEEEFFPALTATSPILNGIEGTPALTGYVGATIKPTAQQILVTEQDDPLLAAWQYGLGRSVAWTSDATGRWASDWANWPEYSRFWSQAVRWTITESASQNVEVRVVQEGENVRVIVDAVDAEGNFLNSVDMEANIVDPDLGTTPITLRQVSPGRYEGSFTPGEQGAYFVRVAGASDEDESVVAQTSGWVLSYSPEYRSFEGDPDYLAFISALADGDIVTDPAQVAARNLRVEAAARPIWPALLLAATLLLPFDIAVRRLVITRRDVERIRARLFPGAAPMREPRSSTVGSLFAAKERAERQTSIRPPSSPTPPVDAASAVKQPAERQPPTPEGFQREGESSSTAGALLSSKRKTEREAPSPPSRRAAPSPTEDAPQTKQPEQPRTRPQPADSSSARGTIGNLLQRKRAREDDDEE